ncbi:helix-turn-helix transcriptional regulator [Priestia aryabhattai]|uniref:helix-turn-helix transcriptional regulator n=1 Tax=Priestia aryabhattai TaxID=412384 RepID=UPI0003A5E37F|nr:helix-turn-helix transcriptional regulator [Priestia aryabhattai]MDT0147973.1 helix-turn-helix transcriptional regulator [Priestia aryabhattai]MDT0154161.1 helix-turn-helix transcriptional regulator [Priestia aryabhattai]MED3922646.1 helix-turn-helix transcriptional regulator [Priestia aryabhattai]MED3956053.1 helix-turn-helix transcriptional regulator [Priestia aryabhattai]MED3990712.1 helix-turn-helix transcriptional regulator [Priestia aryabhattai]
MKSYVFNPTQPEMKSNCYSYIEYRPEQHTQSDISLFYQFNVGTSLKGSLPIIPDGCLDLLFCCDDSNPLALLASGPEERSFYFFEENVDYFGVRLSPQQCKLKFQCSIKEIIQHRQLPLYEVLNIQNNLLEEIAKSVGFKERIIAFNKFLRTKNSHINYAQNLITYCLNKIYTSRGTFEIKELAEDTGYSDRYLRKKFEEHVGYSPKKFSQIVRLQHSVYELLNTRQTVHTITEGYDFYDKSHFYKEFKKYMNITPIEYKYIFK